MNRFLLICTLALAPAVVFAQGDVFVLDEFTPVAAGGPAGALPPGQTGIETEDQVLRRQLVESLQSRIGQMSPEQLRRALMVIESDAMPLPAAAEEVMQAYRQQADAIQQDANRKIAVHRRRAISDLRDIQDRLTRDGQLDEAVAVRDLIRSLSVPPANVLPDPGTLLNFRDKRGQALYFRVTGGPFGSVWGTDVYTDDSTLAAAAVHAGALQNGQTGIVKVTPLPGRDSYPGSTRNGLTTSDWGTYSGSYRVEAVRPDEDIDPQPAEPPREDQPPAASEPACGNAF